MFIIFGVNQRQENLEFNQTLVCPNCGKFGSVQIIMVYTCLSLFFIPTFRWNRKYYAKLSCCGTTVELPKEIGEGIRQGTIRSLDESIFPQGSYQHLHTCSNCGYQTTENFEYCPKCGSRLS